MDAISKIKLNDTDYEIKDEVARGGVLTGTVPAGETLKFTGDTIFCIFTEPAGTLPPVFDAYICANGYFPKIEISYRSDVTMLYSDGEYIVSSVDGHDFDYFLIGATIID